MRSEIPRVPAAPPAKPRERRRVVACVTDGARDPRRARLLVLLHADEPGLLPQLPGGTLEPGEPVGPAGLREAVEETGLERLRPVGYLGTRCIEPARSLCAQTLDTRFVHLECPHPTPVRWPSLEATPHGGGPPVPYECVWVPLASPGPMDARDALALPLVRASLARAGLRRRPDRDGRAAPVRAAVARTRSRT